MSTSLLPLFPLQLVCYPDEEINLHIFEPRYKQLITESESTGAPFGLPTYIQNEPLKWGTEVVLKEIVKKYPDGKMDIRIKGKRVFKINEFFPRMNERLYSGAEVHFPKNDRNVDFSKNKKVLDLMTELHKYLKLHKPLPEDVYTFDSYVTAHFVGLSLEKEYEFLQLLSEGARQDYIIEHLTSIIPVLSEINELEQKVKMNGHFRNIIPPNI